MATRKIDVFARAPEYWVEFGATLVGQKGKSARRPWQVRRRSQRSPTGAIIDRYDTEEAARKRCDDLSSGWLRDLTEEQYQFGLERRTQGRPADAGPDYVVCAASGMVCDCGIGDALDCQQGLKCRQWRDFSITPYGTVFADEDEPFDPPIGTSPPS